VTTYLSDLYVVLVLTGKAAEAQLGG
jgi:hypothetical protein